MTVLVVGAGFTGCVLAEQLASAGHLVIVIDKRDHIGGNAYDEYDAHGVLVHRYGPHIFHTNSAAVFEYLSRFTEWLPYEHRVLSQVESKLLPFPINCDTLNQLYGLTLSEAEAAAFIERVRVPCAILRNSEDVVLTSVGADLCEKFFRNYTRKQWGLDLAELSPSVAGRIPVRSNHDDRYFTDQYQYMPKDGYTALLNRMLYHRNIELHLGVDYLQHPPAMRPALTFYTGPLDGYFHNRLGALGYRSLRFEHQHFVSIDRFQPVGTINYPNNYAYTRITEFKHLTGQQIAGTSIVREYSTSQGEPCYPVPTASNEILATRYRALAATQKAVVFAGRLGQYRYLNIDQAVASALKAAAPFINSVRRTNPCLS
jgi:UDP-galactopyranose mutase